MIEKLPERSWLAAVKAPFLLEKSVYALLI
jgi:hypothetical protein